MVETASSSPSTKAGQLHHFVHANLQFSVGSLPEALNALISSYELVYCSNVLEHVPQIEQTLAALHRRLSPQGALLLAVPPVVTELQLQSNFNNPYHLNNFHPLQWHAKASRFFEKVAVFHHGVRPGVPLDFARDAPARCGTGDFTFTPVSTDELAGRDLETTLTLVMVAERPRGQPLPEDERERAFPKPWNIEKLWRESELERRKVFAAIGQHHYDDAAIRKTVYPISAV
jgi:hypothetical protein